MSERGIHLVREHLAKLPPSNTLTIEQRRAQYERAERVFPTPPDVKVETIAAPARPAEWLTPPGVRTDAVVFYLHGGGYVIGSPRFGPFLAPRYRPERSSAMITSSFPAMFTLVSQVCWALARRLVIGGGCGFLKPNMARPRLRFFTSGGPIAYPYPCMHLLNCRKTPRARSFA